jgi:hypothetical protein
VQTFLNLPVWRALFAVSSNSGAFVASMAATCLTARLSRETLARIGEASTCTIASGDLRHEAGLNGSFEDAAENDQRPNAGVCGLGKNGQVAVPAPTYVNRRCNSEPRVSRDK